MLKRTLKIDFKNTLHKLLKKVISSSRSKENNSLYQMQQFCCTVIQSPQTLVFVAGYFHFFKKASKENVPEHHLQLTDKFMGNNMS